VVLEYVVSAPRKSLARVTEDLDAVTGRGSGRPGIMRGVVDCLAGGLGAGVIAHRPELTTNGWASEQMIISRGETMQRVADATKAFLPRAPLRYALFDALSVQADQQNRLVTDAELRASYTKQLPPVIREVYMPAGVFELHHIRVALSDGPFLLSWLGVWRGRPAFVVNFSGQLVFANEAGRVVLDRDRSIVDEATDAARGAHSARIHSVTPIGTSGAPRHYIVLATDDGAAIEARLRRVIREHQLTVTEARIFARLIRGDANKDIATKERSALRTVEVHVTAVMKKCRVASRARLIAWFWTGQ
jgi:DNA-binding CsgD family transcriptional regulator